MSEPLPMLLHAVVLLLLPVRPEVEPAAQRMVEGDVTRYIAAQIRSMPAFLRLPYRLALLAFEWLPVLRYGHRFETLPLATRAAYLTRWSDAPIGPMRDFIKLIRSTALLVYFDHPLVTERLHAARHRGEASGDLQRFNR